jgi:hypothetical protein
MIANSHEIHEELQQVKHYKLSSFHFDNDSKRLVTTACTKFQKLSTNRSSNRNTFAKVIKLTTQSESTNLA